MCACVRVYVRHCVRGCLLDATIAGLDSAFSRSIAAAGGKGKGNGGGGGKGKGGGGGGGKGNGGGGSGKGKGGGKGSHGPPWRFLKYNGE